MSHRFEFVPAPLKGLYLIERKPIVDQRGFFNRFFCVGLCALCSKDHLSILDYVSVPAFLFIVRLSS